MKWGVMPAYPIMPISRTRAVSSGMAIGILLLLSMVMLSACTQVKTAGCGPIAEPLHPVHRTIYTVRLGSMAATTSPESGDNGLEPMHLPLARSTHAGE